MRFLPSVFGGANACSSLNVIKVRKEKNLPVAPALAGLLPFFLPWALTAFYLHLTPTILYTNLLPFLAFIGISFALQALTPKPISHTHLRAERIYNRQKQRNHEDIAIWEGRFSEMRGDDETDLVSERDPDEGQERKEVLE